eukprot:4862921-Prymnesium_polylepis.1
MTGGWRVVGGGLPFHKNAHTEYKHALGMNLLASIFQSITAITGEKAYVHIHAGESIYLVLFCCHTDPPTTHSLLSALAQRVAERCDCRTVRVNILVARPLGALGIKLQTLPRVLAQALFLVQA